MAETAKKTDPGLWEKVKQEVTEGDKGGRPGQWSARKAQLAAHEYQRAGGGYEGKKAADNHLARWTEEDWGTRSGKESGDTGERYLPRNARDALSDGEYKRTSDKKRADTKKGKQFSAQPKDVARKTAAAGLDALSVAELRKKAADKGIEGRSRMRKAELLEALG